MTPRDQLICLAVEFGPVAVLVAAFAAVAWGLGS